MKKIIVPIIVVSCLFSLSLTSCNKNNQATYERTDMAVNGYAAPKLMKARALASDSMMEESSVNYADSADVQTQSVSTERKLIKSGGITLQVENLSEGQESVESWCKNLGGYVADCSSSESDAYFTVKVPAAKFDEAMNSAGNLGIVKNRNMSTQDVSEQYYDLETRIASKKLMRDNFKRYLAQSTNMSDTIKIERELNNVLSEIESMEGRMRRLSGQIEYSTINVTLRLPGGKIVPDVQGPSFGENLKEFFRNVAGFFSGVFVVICYAVICGIPVLGIICLLFWLLFGKVGLIKKLFRKLK